MATLRIRTIIAICVGLLFFMAPSVYAVPIINSSGQLTGATNVDVNGTLYNVQIGDGGGTCSTCATSSFTFTTLADATSASQALLDQVLQDGIYGSLDSNPALTSGVTDSALGIIVTAYAVDPMGTFISAALAFNFSNPALDGVATTQFLPGAIDFSSDARGTWAVWTKATSTGQVPEPNPLLLLGIGLAALQVVRRKTTRV